MNLQNVIEKALAKTEGVPNHERAARIADFIELAQELTSDIGRTHAVIPPPRPQGVVGKLADPPKSQRPTSNLIVMPTEDEIASLPRMVDAKELASLPVSKSRGSVTTVDQIVKFLQRVAPSYIDVQLDPSQGGTFRYTRKITPEASTFGGEDGEGTVTLSYPDRSDGDCPGYVFSTSDEKIDVQAAVAECTAVAMNRYSTSAEPKRVVARPAKQFAGDLDSVLSSGVGGSADDSDAANSNALRNPTPALRLR